MRARTNQRDYRRMDRHKADYYRKIVVAKAVKSSSAAAQAQTHVRPRVHPR